MPKILRPAALLLILLATARPSTGQGRPTRAIEPGPPLRVVRVVDGDTLVVVLDGRETTIRLIGVDTPETLAPGKAVERGGKEATAFLRQLVAGGSVRLGSEPARRRVDGFNRTLAYAWTVPDSRPINLAILEGNYGRAYVASPFTKIEPFRRAEAEARSAGRGIWASEPPLPVVAAKGQEGEVVYTTDQGKKYHRAGCKYLAKSSYPGKLAELSSRFSPYSICDPPAR